MTRMIGNIRLVYAVGVQWQFGQSQSNTVKTRGRCQVDLLVLRQAAGTQLLATATPTSAKSEFTIWEFPEAVSELHI